MRGDGESAEVRAARHGLAAAARERPGTGRRGGAGPAGRS
jgi:hypothetical protein